MNKFFCERWWDMISELVWCLIQSVYSKDVFEWVTFEIFLEMICVFFFLLFCFLLSFVVCTCLYICRHMYVNYLKNEQHNLESFYIPRSPGLMSWLCIYCSFFKIGAYILMAIINAPLCATYLCHTLWTLKTLRGSPRPAPCLLCYGMRCVGWEQHSAGEATDI